MSQSWKIFFFDIFYVQFNQLLSNVEELKAKDPSGYKSHQKTKLFAKVWAVIKTQIAINPKNKIFNLGDFLPKEYRTYKRAKSGLPARYRMFFRYRSDEGKIIIIWMNDEFSLRKGGSKTDVYAVFLRMLQNKTIPPNWQKLLGNSKEKPIKTASQ